MMSEKVRALALVRASVAEDEDVLQVLLSAPVTGDTFLSLMGIAASALEQAYGQARALDVCDCWLKQFSEVVPDA